MIMENFKKDLDTSSFQSSSEIQFLEQVKECHHHLHCMEKLFFDLQKVPENEKETEKSYTSLNDCSLLTNKTCHSNGSYPDLQLLMQEFETKVNSKNILPKESDGARSHKKEPLHIQLDALNNDDVSNPLTFVIQVPSSIFSLLNRKNYSDQLSNSSSRLSKKKLMKSQRKARFNSLLQKLFGRKKTDAPPTLTIDTNISQNLELLQLLREKKEESISSSLQRSNASHLNYESVMKNSNFTDKSSVSNTSTHTGIDNKLDNLKEKQTFIIPITYNFDENSTTMKPNLTIQLEGPSKNESNAYSNCIKITNEIPVQCTKKSLDILEKETEKDEVKTVPKKDIQPTELLLESLIKALLISTEKLSSLETLKGFVENLSEKELKLKKTGQCSKKYDVKGISEESKALNHILQHLMDDAKSKTDDSKSPQKKVQQIPKRQSSKLSICSSSGSISSDEEPYRSPEILKPKHVQRHARCHSPSMLKYLVCQSERDIDQKVNPPN